MVLWVFHLYPVWIMFGSRLVCFDLRAFGGSSLGWEDCQAAIRPFCCSHSITSTIIICTTLLVPTIMSIVFYYLSVHPMSFVDLSRNILIGP